MFQARNEKQNYSYLSKGNTFTLELLNNLLSIRLQVANKDNIMTFQNLIKSKDLLSFFWKYRNISSDEKDQSEEFVRDLENLGPAYIKFGQLLCTQAPYLFPPEYEEALYRLLDNVKPVSYTEIKKVVEEQFECGIEDVFSSFEKKPLSSASIGQVHVAVLSNRKKVAVKVQKPGIAKQISNDLHTLESMSSFFTNHSQLGKDYQISEVLKEIKETMMNELDYRKEAENMLVMRENLKEFKDIIIPKPIPEYTREKVLTMDFMDGVKLTDGEIPHSPKIEKLGKHLFRAYLKQIFLHGFYHMDPHAGNIFLTDSKLVILDFGMIGKIPSDMRNNLLQLLFALSKGKEEEGTEILIRLGKRREKFDHYIFKKNLSKLFASFNGKSISSFSVGEKLIDVFKAAAESKLWLPAEINSVGKAISNLDQITKILSPNLNPNEEFESYSKELFSAKMTENESESSIYGKLIESAEIAKSLPLKLDFLLDLLAKNDYQLKVKFEQQSHFFMSLKNIANRVCIGLILSSLVIGSALLMNVPTDYRLLGYPVLAMIFFLLAAFGSIIVIIKILYDRESPEL